MTRAIVLIAFGAVLAVISALAFVDTLTNNHDGGTGPVLSVAAIICTAGVVCIAAGVFGRNP